MKRSAKKRIITGRAFREAPAITGRDSHQSEKTNSRRREARAVREEMDIEITLMMSEQTHPTPGHLLSRQEF
jgi:hypothetical protein